MSSARTKMLGDAARAREAAILADACARMRKELSGIPVQPGFITLARKMYAAAEWEYERRRLDAQTTQEIDRSNIMRNRRIAGRSSCLNTAGIKIGNTL